MFMYLPCHLCAYHLSKGILNCTANIVEMAGTDVKISTPGVISMSANDFFLFLT